MYHKSNIVLAFVGQSVCYRYSFITNIYLKEFRPSVQSNLFPNGAHEARAADTSQYCTFCAGEGGTVYAKQSTARKWLWVPCFNTMSTNHAFSQTGWVTSLFKETVSSVMLQSRAHTAVKSFNMVSKDARRRNSGGTINLKGKISAC